MFENFDETEGTVVLKNFKDVFFGLSVAGIMMMLSGEKNTPENQTAGLEWFKDHEKDLEIAQEWADYQLTLINTGEYTMPIAETKSDEFMKTIIELILNNRNVEFVFSALLASSQYDAGMIHRNKNYKDYIRDYCDNVLLVKVPEFSVMDMHDEFYLLTGQSLYYALTELGFDKQSEHVLRVVEADRKRVDKLNSK